jgi:hypothetical protein
MPERPVARPGDRIRVTGILPNDPSPLKVGEMGTVVRVTPDAVHYRGTIDVAWDSGRTLSLLLDDPYEVAPGETKQDSEPLPEFFSGQPVRNRRTGTLAHVHVVCLDGIHLIIAHGGRSGTTEVKAANYEPDPDADWSPRVSVSYGAGRGSGS